MAEDQGKQVRQAVGSTGHRAEPGLARTLSELARELQADITNEALLKHIVTAAVTEIPGATYAGITLVTGREIATPAVSDELVIRIDQVQYESDEGPCLDAVRHRETVRSDDLRTEARWPRFTRRAVDLGALSVLSFQLFVEAETFGALNVYSGKAGALGPESESAGLLFASHAAIAMTASRTEAGLAVAMDTRDLIGQAKGILIERYKITGVQAFGLLVASSQAANLKLRDVADHLVATGELLTSSRHAQANAKPEATPRERTG